MESERRICPVCGASSSFNDTACSECGHGQWFRLQDIEEAFILTVMPEMCPETAAIERIGNLVIQAKSSPSIIVNLSHVRFLSTTFVDRFAMLKENVNAAQGRLTLCGASPAVQDVFKLMNLGCLLDFGGSNACEAVAV